MKAITVSKFRSSMKEYMDYVEDAHDTLIIPRSGDKTGVVLMSLDDYNALMESLYLRASPKNHERLMAGIRQVEAGMVVTKSLDELGIAE